MPPVTSSFLPPTLTSTVGKYFSKKEIIDIVSVIALFGYLNRWNDTLGTVLEDVPENFVENKLKPLGWS